jgi:hypothetical protein
VVLRLFVASCSFGGNRPVGTLRRVSFETAIHQWKAGERYVAAAEPAQVRALERVEEELLRELRRRLGGAFTVDELVELYEAGTGWCLDLAARLAPGAPWTWDARVADAAFARYVREAADYAGGRRIEAAP